MLVPADIRYGRGEAMIAQRECSLAQAWSRHPQPTVHGKPKPQAFPREVWINRLGGETSSPEKGQLSVISDVPQVLDLLPTPKALAGPLWTRSAPAILPPKERVVGLSMETHMFADLVPRVGRSTGAIHTRRFILMNGVGGENLHMSWQDVGPALTVVAAADKVSAEVKALANKLATNHFPHIEAKLESVEVRLGERLNRMEARWERMEARLLDAIRSHRRESDAPGGVA